MIRKVVGPRVRAEGIEAARSGLSEIRLLVAYQCRHNVVVSRARAAGVKLSVSRPSIATYKKRA